MTARFCVRRCLDHNRWHQGKRCKSTYRHRNTEVHDVSEKNLRLNTTVPHRIRQHRDWYWSTWKPRCNQKRISEHQHCNQAGMPLLCNFVFAFTVVVGGCLQLSCTEKQFLHVLILASQLDFYLSTTLGPVGIVWSGVWFDPRPIDPHWSHIKLYSHQWARRPQPVGLTSEYRQLKHRL